MMKNWFIIQGSLLNMFPWTLTKQILYVAVVLSVVTNNTAHVKKTKISATAKKIGNLMFEVKQETVSLGRKSHMECLEVCMTRKSCFFISSTHRPDLPLSKNKPYKCHLYNGNATVTLNITQSCREQWYPITYVPGVLAGACADHNCNNEEICKPMPKAKGYYCVIADMKERRKRARLEAKKKRKLAREKRKREKERKQREKGKIKGAIFNR